MYDRNGSFIHCKMNTVSTFQTTFSANLSTLRCANLDEAKWHRRVFNLYKRTHLGRWAHALSWLPTSHGKSLEKGRIFIFDEAPLHPLSCSPCERQHIEFFSAFTRLERRKKKLGRSQTSVNAKLQSGSIMVHRAVSRWRRTRDPTSRILLVRGARAVIG